MASKFFVGFFVYDRSSDVPLTGSAASMSLITYKSDVGVDVTPVPEIVEVGGGAYKFTPKIVNPREGVFFVVNTGPSGKPAHVHGYVRPEDLIADHFNSVSGSVDLVKKIVTAAPFNPFK